MQFNNSRHLCEICHKPRQRGNHDKCSRKKQELGALQKTNKTQSTRTYENSRLLTGFLKTIE